MARTSFSNDTAWNSRALSASDDMFVNDSNSDDDDTSTQSMAKTVYTIDDITDDDDAANAPSVHTPLCPPVRGR